VVGGFDELDIVLDDQDGVAAVDEVAEGLDELRDVGVMQAGGRLVEEEEAVAVAPGRLEEERGQLEALRLAAGEGADRLDICTPAKVPDGFGYLEPARGRGRISLITLDVNIGERYCYSVIRSWADAEAEKIFSLTRSRKLPTDIQRVALRKLRMIDAATSLEDLRLPPANRLEKLSGDRKGQWSIRINDQWRICFAWQDGNANGV
jgi:proteic killer suppression protein